MEVLDTDLRHCRHFRGGFVSLESSVPNAGGVSDFKTCLEANDSPLFLIQPPDLSLNIAFDVERETLTRERPVGMGPLSLAPMFPQLIEAFHSNLTDVVQFTGIAILVLGFSNFIWFVFSYVNRNVAIDKQLQGSIKYIIWSPTRLPCFPTPLLR